MAEEDDVVDFLKKTGCKATLEEVSNGLNLPKYGPQSAYSLLHSLRSKRTVDRKGEKWVLLTEDIELQEGKSPPLPPTPSAEKKGRDTEASTDFEQMTKTMAETLTEAIKNARQPTDERELAAKPMETEIERELSDFVLKPDTASEAKKELVAIPTGTFLDNLFLLSEGKPLGGLPTCGQFAVIGLPGAGKSILIEEIAVRVSASSREVLFVTSEDAWRSPTPRFDLQSRMKQKADTLNLDWETIRKNLFVLDTVLCQELRNWNNLSEAYRNVVETEDIELAIINSVTNLEADRDTLKHHVMELTRYNQIRGVTGLFVNHRSTETWNPYDVVGGTGLAYNLDGAIIVDYERVYWQDQQGNLDVKRGEFVRIARVLNCRLSNFEREKTKIEITPDGFIRPIRPIKPSK